MTVPAFVASTNLNNSLLFGFYGGGNYGDELLMEVLATLLAKKGTRHVTIAYQHPQNYTTFHHDFGYPRVDMHNKKSLFTTVLSKKTIIVGGGGLWGMDVNANILLLSLLLAGARLLGKRVYLLAVGYYSSTSRMGHLSAWLAGKAANYIIARDQETYANFSRVTKHLSLGNDLATAIPGLNLQAYEADVAELEKRVHIAGKTLFFTLRRFTHTKHHLNAAIGEWLSQNANHPIILALMEPKEADPEGYQLLQAWQKRYPNVQILDFSFNPLALFMFFRKYHDQLVYIGPQFHGILSAHLTGVPYLPLVYDNKVQNLLTTIAPGRAMLKLEDITAGDITTFISQAMETA